MKRILGSLLSVLLLSVAALSQGPSIPVGPTFTAGTFYSPNYNYGNNTKLAPLKVTTGTTATGAGTLTLAFGTFNTPDGRIVAPFTGVPTLPTITVDSGAAQETVTVTAASCATPQIINTCSITATFANTHGAGVAVNSGSGGITEAINDAAVNGGGAVYWIIDPGSVTLATGAANTNIGTTAIPVHSIVFGATGRVTTTIGTCAGGWSLGFTTGLEFTAANTNLTAGSTLDTTATIVSSVPVAFNIAATIPVIHCTTSNASSGAVHARIWGVKLVSPAS